MATLAQRILRLVQPKTESQRRDFRMLLACASAHAEDLNRTACFLAEDIACTGRKPAPDKGSKPT